MPFIDSLDIANRSLDHVGAQPILSITEDSDRNMRVSAVYDKVRRAELRRNVWRFAIRRTALRAIDTTTRLLVPGDYDATVTYLPGAIVRYTNGGLWVSFEQDNLNNAPGASDAWDMYFGPLTVSIYSSGTSYFAGELVYVLGALGAYSVYMSKENGNSDVPGTATPWSATVTYGNDAVVSFGGSQWRSIIPLNLNLTPTLYPADFDIAHTYNLNDQVVGSNGVVYKSAISFNLGIDPTTDTGVNWTNLGTTVTAAWEVLPAAATVSNKWVKLTATLKSLQVLYPIGSGPSSQSTTRNLFRLPAGYIREAPQDPKAGSDSYLGAATGLEYSNWDFAGDYIVSAYTNPILFRFVADVMDVSGMDDMFCEGLACRIAVEVCEGITQSTSKLGTIASAYKLFMGEARTVNAIETGPVEPPVDSFVSCRA